MTRNLPLIIGILFFAKIINAQLLSPDEFLPHKLGEHFTPHHLLVDYYKHVSENSPLVKFQQYGQTNQKRPLIMAFISSEENLKNLDDIRMNNLKTAGLESGKIDKELLKVIVWLSFSVHGNEAAGSESSFQVLYDLANPTNAETKKWLENTIVILDPSINPDGYSRYTHWVRNVTSQLNNENSDDIEHNEPWPGGRVNHFLFDLNRDWAWQTQVESQARLKIYNQWLPQVHVDLHEMGTESPYYFAPASKPYHQYITAWQREFQSTIGKNHTKYFDKQGWLYFTREVFDLLYPSYGDTYPIYSGAIGMTYEQGGSGRAGRAIKTLNGEILKLKERIEHHKTTALSTIEASSNNSALLLDHFEKFFKESRENPKGEYKSYIIKSDDSGQRISALADLLEKQGIKLETISENQTIDGYIYNERKQGKQGVKMGDLLISAYQTKSVLAQVLLDPETALEDSLTYDITAWSLPYAYGLEAIALKSKINGTSGFKKTKIEQKPQRAYAYLMPWTGLESVKTLAKVLSKEIDARVATNNFQIGNKHFAKGTIAITFADNRSMGEQFYAQMNEITIQANAEIIPMETGLSQTGPDLGSGQFDLIRKPKVLTILGDGISSNDYGQVKWFFDKILQYPLTSVDQERLNRIDLSKYNILIMPDGRYSLNNNIKTKLSEWTSNGGKLIVLEGAMKIFEEVEGFKLKKYAEEADKTEGEKQQKQADLAARYHHFSDLERISLDNYIPGAIFKLKMDQTHPLAYGLGENYYTLKTNNIKYPLMVGAQNAFYHPSDGTTVIGFAGQKISEQLKNTFAFAVESKGRGQVVYMTDNPLFRGFWYNGLVMFSNALFLVN